MSKLWKADNELKYCDYTRTHFGVAIHLLFPLVYNFLFSSGICRLFFPYFFFMFFVIRRWQTANKHTFHNKPQCFLLFSSLAYHAYQTVYIGDKERTKAAPKPRWTIFFLSLLWVGRSFLCSRNKTASKKKRWNYLCLMVAKNLKCKLEIKMISCLMFDFYFVIISSSIRN